MSTTEVSIAITCPPWCVDDPEHHAAQLWTMEGNVIHNSECMTARDNTGYVEPLTEPRLYKPIELRLTTCTALDGRETTSSVLFIDNRETSIQQALDLADAIRALVETYRNNGGVE